jgi:Amt family ammonium transporter
MNRQLIKPAIAGIVLLAGTAAAWAQDASEAVVEAATPLPNPGNTTWMMVASLLVLMMCVPGLALFYGGMVRSKNVLSLLMQVLMITCTVAIVWALWGYTEAFGDGGGSIISGFGKAFLAGIDFNSVAATFSDEVIPEYVFVVFQATFACITAALIVGGFAERIKFSALMLFIVLWVTFVYFPIAHMVWAGGGLAFEWGVLDFAGGTVVHINAGIAGFVGALVIGKVRL